MEPSVYPCDRCSRVFDTIKIVQGIYGTRHCNKCVKELHNHAIRERVASWNRNEPSELEADSVSIQELTPLV